MAKKSIHILLFPLHSNYPQIDYGTKLIERDITNGYLNNDKELIWLEDGGGDEVDVLINLDESKLETFVVHQHG